ncbi:MAG: SoxR reducing system RseC family protein [Gammaproteobacteria bacterium]|nr:SoxR reducing system RseC family protein [Gammaproteobacteria bacterium]NNC76885.1 SoxR reducing system RseC family protein [Woeseiaceae bacterium]
MNVAPGKVVSVSDDARGRLASIDVEASEICARCAAGKGCGAGLFGARQSTRRLEAVIPHGSNISAGDNVKVALEPRNLLSAATIVYGWPLFGAALGAGAAYVANYGDAAAAFCALAGMLGGAFLARRRLRSSRCLNQFRPRIIA